MRHHEVEMITATPLRSLLNFRDVGAIINRLDGSPMLREGVLFRSARPDDANILDRTALISTYHITTVIDLRSTTELFAANKRNAAAHASSLAAGNGEQAANAVKIEGINYHEINLNGGKFAMSLIWKLRWSSLTKFMSLMAFGYRSKAISILGMEVMAPRGLIGLGKDTLNYSTAELLEVFSVLANGDNYPILVHCTQGKDRTGLVIVLLLLLLKVPMDCIILDYLASEKQLEFEKASRLIEIRQVGLPDEFVGCPPAFVAEMTHHINSIYGGPEKYLQTLGVNMAMQEQLRENMRLERSNGKAC